MECPADQLVRFVLGVPSLTFLNPSLTFQTIHLDCTFPVTPLFPPSRAHAHLQTFLYWSADLPCTVSSAQTSITDIITPQRRKQHLSTTPSPIVSAATTIGKGDNLCLPGDTHSPHPPCSIRTGSNFSHSSQLTLNDHHLSHDPSLDAPGDKLVSQSRSQSEHHQHPPVNPTSNISNTPGDGKDTLHKMIFTDLYKSPKSPLSRLRHPHQSHLALQSSDFDPDLISKDKAKQKEAVKRHLQSKVRNDWVFPWPPVEGAPATKETEHLETPSEEAPLSAELEGYLEIASDDPELNGKAVDGEETASNSGEEADSETDSVYSTISETRLQWKPRLEWASELSDDELPYNSPSPFKYDTPDSIGQAVNASKIAQKIRRRRELRKEMAWNDGLACFEARRNVWTDAKVARVRPKSLLVSPSSQRRSLFWRTHTHPSSNAGQPAMSPTSITSSLSPVTTNSQPDTLQPLPNGAESDHSTSNHLFSPKTSSSDSPKHSNAQTEQYPVETLLPIPPPLLPPANPMRASITPALYSSIYEKVVVHSLQPSCPINLGDMVRACVVGWKRDGEWPPRPMAPEPAAVVAVKRRKPSASALVDTPHDHMAIAGAGGHIRKMSFSFLGGHGPGNEKAKGRRESVAEEGSGGSGKGIRKSLQKVLGIGQHPSPPITAVADGNTAPQAN